MSDKVKKVYNSFLRLFIKKSFPIWQRIGFHITPNHFYEPVPDTRTLKDELEKAFSSYNRTSVWPGSFWMRRKIGKGKL